MVTEEVITPFFDDFALDCAVDFSDALRRHAELFAGRVGKHSLEGFILRVEDVDVENDLATRVDDADPAETVSPLGFAGIALDTAAAVLNYRVVLADSVVVLEFNVQG